MFGSLVDPKAFKAVPSNGFTTEALNEESNIQAPPIYVPVKTSPAKELWQRLGEAVPQLLPKDTASYIAVMVIAMFLVAIPSLGLLMIKDTKYRIAEKAALSIEEISAAAGQHAQDTLTATREKMKLEKAPMVKGLKESLAIEKLKAADVDIEKVEITHEKMTFPELVKKTDLFFGEVQEQKVSKKGITLVIPQADEKDPFTMQMLAMGSRLAWPVPGHERLSSHFGRRSSPGGIGSTNHQGIDIPAPTGTPIIAVKEGTVELAKSYGGYGNCVIIDHKNGFKSLYGHMSVITCNAGDTVKPGDIIGKVGSTGWSTGAHLHFGLLKNGQYIDPEPFFTGKDNVKPGEEVSENTEQTENQENPENTEEAEKNREPDDNNKPGKEKPAKPEPTKPSTEDNSKDNPTDKPEATPTTTPAKPEPAPTRPEPTKPAPVAPEPTSPPEPEPEPEPDPEPEPTTQPVLEP